MVKLYYDLIKHDPPLWTIEQVPTKWRADVQAVLDAEAT